MLNGDCEEAFDFYKNVSADKLPFLEDTDILQWKFRKLKKAGFKEVLGRSKSRPIMRFTIY
ncbi:MAG: hypothetical protein QMC48_07675 [SAR324 cluster bacterium]|jgi:hypothetical protein